MTKHIIGFIIFSFIVGTSAVIGSLFYVAPKAGPVNFSEAKNEDYKKRNKCPKKGKHRESYSDRSLASVINAVYDERYDQLGITVAVEDDSLEATKGTVDVALHFYVSDKFSTRYLATEFISVLINDSQIPSRKYEFSWLTNLQSHDDLYVIPEFVGDRGEYQKNPPVFDRLAAKAIQVRNWIK